MDSSSLAPLRLILSHHCGAYEVHEVNLYGGGRRYYITVKLEVAGRELSPIGFGEFLADALVRLNCYREVKFKTPLPPPLQLLFLPLRDSAVTYQIIALEDTSLMPPANWVCRQTLKFDDGSSLTTKTNC